MKTVRMISFLTVCLTLAMTTLAFAQCSVPASEDVKAPKKEYSPYVDDHFPINVYFGDTHLHTAWSADSGDLPPLLVPHPELGCG